MFFSPADAQYTFQKWVPSISFLVILFFKQFYCGIIYIQLNSFRCTVSQSWLNIWDIQPPSHQILECFSFFKILFICQSEHKQGERQAEGEAGFPPNKEPDAGLHPRTLGSWPEPKADAQLTESSRHPSSFRMFLNSKEFLCAPTLVPHSHQTAFYCYSLPFLECHRNGIIITGFCHLT